ncbi:MAG: protein kinase [Planctomycetes bacterium]|nr:protein kinase [Planctomycetota bacterium]
MLKIDQIILGKYQVIDLIQECGQALLAKGVDSTSGATVAIRQLLARPGQTGYENERARFYRAAELRINQINVVDTLEYGEDLGEFYMIMPYVEGQTLDQFVAAKGGRLSPDSAVSIARQIAAGLAACHAHGVTHRDIKPENILVDTNNRAFIIDFGICSLAGQPTITQGDGFQGSLRWASPEQIVDPRSRDPRLDLFALGGVFYFMLTGLPPSEGATPQDIMMNICKVMPPPPKQLLTSLPDRIDRACMKLLAKEPSDRFQSAEQFIQALDPTSGAKTNPAICRSCRAAVDSLSNFCFHCGASIGDSVNGYGLKFCLACGARADELKTCPSCNRIFSSVDHRFEFVLGALSGVTFRIPQGMFVTGREILCPRDFQISRRHLQCCLRERQCDGRRRRARTRATTSTAGPPNRPSLWCQSVKLQLPATSAFTPLVRRTST